METPKSSAPMTVKDVAQKLKVSEASVRSYERSGLLRAIKTASGMRLFSPTDVAQFAEDRRER